MFLFLFAAIITNACGKNSQKPEIGSILRVPICEDDGIPVLTVFLKRMRVLQARKKPALKLTGFKSAVPALAHPAAVAAAEAFIGFCDLLELIACKQQPAPIWEIQNRPVPFCDLAPMRIKFIGVGRSAADEWDKSLTNRNKCLVVINFTAHIRKNLFSFIIAGGTESFCAARFMCAQPASSASNSSSVKVGTPSCCAFVSLLPAFSPTIR